MFELFIESSRRRGDGGVVKDVDGLEVQLAFVWRRSWTMTTWRALHVLKAFKTGDCWQSSKVLVSASETVGCLPTELSMFCSSELAVVFCVLEWHFVANFLRIGCHKVEDRFGFLATGCWLRWKLMDAGKVVRGNCPQMKAFDRVPR